MKISRRGLFGLCAAAIAAPFVPVPTVAATGIRAVILDAPTCGTMGGINRATFSFWRNQGTSDPHAFDNLRTSMRDVYNQCSIEGTVLR